MAVILAAGLGQRLHPHTEHLPKALMQLGSETLLERALRLLAEAGLNEAYIVVGHAADAIREFVASRQWQIAIRIISNDRYLAGNNIYSVAAAADVLARNDTILIECDVVFRSEHLLALLEAAETNALLAAPYTSYTDGAVVTVDAAGTIVKRLCPQPGQTDPAWLKTVNIARLSSSFNRELLLPLVEALGQTGAQLYYDDIIGIAINHRLASFQAVSVGQDEWFEVDNVADLKIASDLTASLDGEARAMHSRHGGYWKFPTFQDSCLLVNPWFPTEDFLAEMSASADLLVRSYPSGHADQAILAERAFGVRAEYLAVGNGASELIAAAIDALPGVVAMTAPSFEEYFNRIPAARLRLLEPVAPWPRDLTAFTEFAAAVEAQAAFLVNPENPTGEVVPADRMLDFVKEMGDRGVNVLVDESFIEFAPEGPAISLFENDTLTANPHLVVLKSISKTYGVPGIRLGVAACANEATIDAIRGRLPIWNVGSFAERFLEIIPRHRRSFEASLEAIERQRKRLFESLAAIDYLRPLPSAANYILCEVTPPWTAARLTDHLLRYHRIMIKDCTGKRGFAGAEFVRIAVGDDLAMARLGAALQQSDGLERSAFDGDAGV